MPVTAIQALLFDKDGTLLDFQATWGGWAADLVAELAPEAGLDPARMAADLGIDLAARRIDPASVIVAGSLPEIAAELVRLGPAWDPAAMTARLNTLSARATPRPVCDLPLFLARLAGAGLHLGVATNDAEAVARLQAECLGIAPHLGFIAGYDSGWGGKPGPGMCLAFARACGLDPARIAMIGDSAHDLIAGRAAGMVTVAVETGPAPAGSLKHLADAILPDITHLPAWLGHR